MSRAVLSRPVAYAALVLALTPVVALTVQFGSGRVEVGPADASLPTRTTATRPKPAPPSRLRGLDNHPAMQGRGDKRHPKFWPYPRNSIWNHPLGSSADLVPMPISPPVQKTLVVEDDIIVATPHIAPRPIFYSPVGWDRGASRCAARTSRVLVPGVPVPRAFRTDPGYVGLTPNQSAAIVMKDGSLIETQPFHACADGSLVSKVAPPAWRGSVIGRGGSAAEVGAGAHGGSGLTAFGGTIRLGEWVRGGVIPHAVKVVLDASIYLSTYADGYRWPALQADSYAPSTYGGTNPAARMGSLLALPPTFDIRSLRTSPAKILARALQRYGAYVVDDAARDAVAFPTEWSPAGRVSEQFEAEWGFPLSGQAAQSGGAQAAFLNDMLTMYQQLHVVDDNTAASVGGAGTPMAPSAPLLTGWPRPPR